MICPGCYKRMIEVDAEHWRCSACKTKIEQLTIDNVESATLPKPIKGVVVNGQKMR